MAERAEDLYNQLQDVASILALIGEPEDAHFDCKEWPSKDDDAQKMLAKAASGMTNADGGVLVIGMKAESRPNDEPDVVTAAAPVHDTTLVRSRVLDLMSKLVEPGIVGIVADEIADARNAKTGFVVVYIPKSEGPPHRSRKDWKFYQRIGSATLPMDYWQIEAMFGKRPLAKLELHLEVTGVETPRNANPSRRMIFGLRNDGRGIAKFPGIRFTSAPGLQIDSYGIDGNMGFGLPLRPSSAPGRVFRGGVDDVIYPGETREIGKLIQPGQYQSLDGRILDVASVWNQRNSTIDCLCKAVSLSCEISCEGSATRTVQQDLAEVLELVDTRHW